jgi:cytidine deaminase
LSASDKRWPEVERRKGDRRASAERRTHERRTGRDRRNEAAWVPVPVDDSDRSDDDLIAAARRAREHARAAFSRFKVGAALEAADGTVFSGCNVENATYGLTVCAERVALLKALSEGHSAFRRLAIVADTADPTPPCGACRQLLWEYCGDLPLVLANLERATGRYALSHLLPLPFDTRLLKSGGL